MFEKISENWWKWRSVEVLEAPFGTWAASWSQDGAQDRQEEPQEAPRQPTWRQDWPTWLQDGVPNLLPNHEKSIEKCFLFVSLIDFWRDLRAKVDEKSIENMIKIRLQTRWAKTMKCARRLGENEIFDVSPAPKSITNRKNGIYNKMF